MLGSLRLPDGGIYALPWKTNPEMLMYNVDLLAAAGIAPPRTHSELLDAFRRLARDTDGDGRLDRWALWAPLKTTWHERFYDFYPLYLASSGGRTFISNGQVMFDNEAAVAAIEVLRRGFAEGLLPRANFALGRDPFVDGTVAMKIIGSWFVLELEQLKTPGLRYDVTPIPAADGTNAGPTLRLRRSAKHRHLLDDEASRRRGAFRRVPDLTGRRSPADRGGEPAAVPARARVGSAVQHASLRAVADARRPTPRTSSGRATSISIPTSSRSSTSSRRRTRPRESTASCPSARR